MKVRIDSAITLERWRDALDYAVDADGHADGLVARAIVDIDWTGGTLELTSSGGARLVSADRQQVARFDIDSYDWEILHTCDECGREEYSEHKEWWCNCVIEPESANPEGWRE